MAHRPAWNLWSDEENQRCDSVGFSPAWKRMSFKRSASFGEQKPIGPRSALRALSHPSVRLEIPPVWLALMLTAHWQSDWLVWEEAEEEEGKGGRGWMAKKKNPHPPTGRQGALTERNSSRLSAERGGERTSSFFRVSGGPPLKTRTSGLPGAVFCLLLDTKKQLPQ